MNVSVVMTTRNDNFGGNMIEMMTACLHTMSRTFDEVIVVDLGSKEPIYPLLKMAIPEERGNIRVINVPHEWVIARVPDTSTMPDVLGRNIGIRRASHDVILSSNIDIIPAGKDKFDFSNFDKDVFYTSGKYMVDISLLTRLRSQGNTWEIIQNHLFDNKRTFYRQGPVNAEPWSIMSACGDFQMGHRDIWFHPDVRGFEESLIYKDYVDTNIHKKIIENAHIEVRIAPDFHVFHQSHANNRGKAKLNNINVAALQFTNTTNTKNWGYPNETFEENIL